MKYMSPRSKMMASLSPVQSSKMQFMSPRSKMMANLSPVQPSYKSGRAGFQSPYQGYKSPKLKVFAAPSLGIRGSFQSPQQIRQRAGHPAGAQRVFRVDELKATLPPTSP